MRKPPHTHKPIPANGQEREAEGGKIRREDHCACGCSRVTMLRSDHVVILLGSWT